MLFLFFFFSKSQRDSEAFTNHSLLLCLNPDKLWLFLIMNDLEGGGTFDLPQDLDYNSQDPLPAKLA